MLRESYQKELEAMLHPPISPRGNAFGIAMAVGLLITVALIVRADVFYHIRGLMLVGHATLAAALLFAAVLIFRDLRKRTHSHKSASSISGALTTAAGVLTVVALMIGLGHSSDPKSLYGAFYVFVFYFACAVWSLDNRVKSTELAAREQMLRIECRLADLTDRIQK
jgi:hypothetical protein